MISYGKRFLSCEAHIARNYINALLTVTVGQLIVILKGINSLPLSFFVLYVSEAFFINRYFAKIVKKRNYGNALIGIRKAKGFLYACRVKIADKAIVYVQRMLAQTALIG